MVKESSVVKGRCRAKRAYVKSLSGAGAVNGVEMIGCGLQVTQQRKYEQQSEPRFSWVK